MKYDGSVFQATVLEKNTNVVYIFNFDRKYFLSSSVTELSQSYLSFYLFCNFRTTWAKNFIALYFTPFLFVHGCIPPTFLLKDPDYLEVNIKILEEDLN